MQKLAKDRARAGLAWLAATLLGCGTPEATPEAEGTQGSGRPDAPDASGSSGETGALPLECGNGLRQPGESCDDGNLIWGDGCNPDCTVAAQTNWARSYLREGGGISSFDLGRLGSSALFVVYDHAVLKDDQSFIQAGELEIFDAEGNTSAALRFSNPAVDTRVSGAAAAEDEVYVLLTNLSTREVRLVAVDTAGELRWSTQLFTSEPFSLDMRISTRGSTIAVMGQPGLDAALYVVQRSTGQVLEQASLATGQWAEFGALAVDEDESIWASLALSNMDGANVWHWEPGALPRLWRFDEPHDVLDLHPTVDRVEIVASRRFVNKTSIRRFDREGSLINEVFPESPGGYDYFETFFLRDVLRSQHGDYVGVQVSSPNLTRFRPDGGVLWHLGLENSLAPSDVEEGPDGQLYVAGAHSFSNETLFWISSIAP